MAEIVISEFIDEAAVENLERRFDVLYDPDLWKCCDRLPDALASCRAWIVRNQSRVEVDLLERASRLEVIGRLGVGVDNIDMESCERRGITVLLATGANETAVAEYVIAGLLILFRGAFHATGSVIDGKWPRLALIGREVHGKRLGLIGFGQMARALAKRAQALGMTVVAYDKYFPADSPVWSASGVDRGTLEEVLESCDAISLHVPLTAETRHLIDGVAIASMRPGTLLVNTARGEVVDDASLIAALRSGTLAGALLDVFPGEPLRDGGLYRDVPNLLLSPHVAGLTVESNARVSADIADRIGRFLLRAHAAERSEPPSP